MLKATIRLLINNEEQKKQHGKLLQRRHNPLPER